METVEALWRAQIEEWSARGLRRTLRTVEGPQGREVVVGGRRRLNFSSNDYLGLAGDPRLAAAAAASLRRDGFGAGASRLVCGHMRAHARLEEELARFKGAEAALVFSTGYMANVGILSALFGPHDRIFFDRLDHASLVDGILLSRARWRRYPHRDMGALERMLAADRGGRLRAIVTDTVFSMDGDIAPLDRIVDLAERYGCLVMIDDAHGLGVLGAGGRGAAEHFGVEDRVAIRMGTLSKAVGGFGAYVCGSALLREILLHRARSLVYTTGLPPCVAEACRVGIEILACEPERRDRLHENRRYLAAGLKAMGIVPACTETPIFPLIVGGDAPAVSLARRLADEGILAVAIRPPTVPEGTARLRITVTAAHRREDIDRLLEALDRADRALDGVLRRGGR